MKLLICFQTSTVVSKTAPGTIFRIEHTMVLAIEQMHVYNQPITTQTAGIWLQAVKRSKWSDENESLVAAVF